MPRMTPELAQAATETNIGSIIAALVEDSARFKSAGSKFEPEQQPGWEGFAVTGKDGAYMQVSKVERTDDTARDPNRMTTTLHALAEYAGVRAQVQITDGEVQLADFRDGSVKANNSLGEPTPQGLADAAEHIKFVAGEF